MRFEMKMCHISAVPRPSSSSTPKVSIHSRWSSTGSASPADVHTRSDDKSCDLALGCVAILWIIVGTLISIGGAEASDVLEHHLGGRRLGEQRAAAAGSERKNRFEPVA